MKSSVASRRRIISTQAGFSLIEVLASTTIVAIAAVGLTASSITTIKSNAFSRDAMTATSLAQDRIEQFRALLPSQVSLLKSGGDSIARQAGSPTFTRQWVVMQGPTAGLVEVTMIVRWNGPEPRSVRSAAYLCRAANC